ncbi:MAG: response regulator [Anaerolineales bacterium]|nr:response regulator [Anaerolineales bacterium]
MTKPNLILLAFDASPILTLMERTLNAANFDVALAGDQAGLNKSLQEVIPALVILGRKFAGGDGLAISKEVLERFPTLPIILYAETDDPELARQALRMGLSDYLSPPLKVDDISNSVNRSLARARQLGDWVRREVKRTTSSLAEKAKMSESERTKLEAIINNIQDGVIVLDDQRKILLVNRSIRAIFNLGAQTLIGKSLDQIIANADVLALLARSSENPLKYHEINFDDGKVYNAQYTPIPKVGAAITMQDISYLKELDRLKNDFVHTVSHDLRSPLTAILGYTELIGRTGPLNENQLEFLHRLQGSVQHITVLINDLLDLGRLEAGFDTRREMVHLDTVLKSTLDMVELQARKKKIKITTKVDPGLKPLRANPVRIRQMLDNLVSNAVKYTQDEGTVKVSLLMRDGQIVLQVEDDGPGIPPEEQSRVFDKFYRATNMADNESVEGSGLGLAIVKSIVESHQGRVWVESTLGSGSTFFAILPTEEEN